MCEIREAFILCVSNEKIGLIDIANKAIIIEKVLWVANIRLKKLAVVLGVWDEMETQ